MCTLRLLDCFERIGDSLEFRVAPETLRELSRSPEADAADVLAWAHELVAYAAPHDWHDEASSHRQAPLFSDFARPGDAVPDAARPYGF